MKVGDLVKYKKGQWHTQPNCPERLGIIIDENPKYYFVSWIGDNWRYFCERKNALELAK